MHRHLYSRPVRDYACAQSGLCCRSWDVTFDDHEARVLTHWLDERQDPRAAGVKDETARLPDGMRRLPMNAEGCCVFLEEALCGIRVAGGLSARPATCSQYPYIAMLTPAGVTMTLQLSCPTARRLVLGSGVFELVVEDRDVFVPRIANATLPLYRCTLGCRRAVDAGTWWTAHRDWFRWFRAAHTAPVGPTLSGLVERMVDGFEAPGHRFEWARVTDASPCAEVSAQFAAAGGDTELLTQLWEPVQKQAGNDVPTAGASVEPVVHRYLVERLFVPFYLGYALDARQLASALLLLHGRIQLERARGTEINEAIRTTDTLFCGLAKTLNERGYPPVDAAAIIGLGGQ